MFCEDNGFNKDNFLGLRPTGLTGAGTIPAKHHGQKPHLAVPLSLKLEASVGIQHSKEVVFMGRGIKLTNKTIATSSLKTKMIVVAMVSCLLLAPLTRGQEILIKHDKEQ